jgi:hypothetical protein
MKKLLLFASVAVLALGASPLGRAAGAVPVPPADSLAAGYVDAVMSSPVTPIALPLIGVLALAATVAGATRRLSVRQYLSFAGAIGASAMQRIVNAMLPASACVPLRLSVDAWTKLADLWVPEVLVEGMQEPVIERTAFLDSGVCVGNAEMRAIVEAGRGTEIEIPFIIEPNHDDQQQQEDTAPDIKKMSSGLQRAALFRRVSTLGATALSGVISGVKPGGDILTVLLGAVQGLRKRQRNRLVLKALSGLFHVASAPNAGTGAFRALRKDYFSETGAAPAEGFLIESTKMLQAIGLLGEVKEVLTGGAILMHSDIETALVDQDQIDVIKNSEGEIIMRRWKGLQVFISDLLVRNGGVSGKVYYTFFCARGSIAMEDKPQVVTDLAGPTAALQLAIRDVAKNNVALYDRTQFVLHPQGAKWNPQVNVPAIEEAGPSNAELADYQNWALGANDIRNTRIVCLRTNG